MLSLKKISDPKFITICVLTALAVTGLLCQTKKAGRLKIVHEAPVSELPDLNISTVRIAGIDSAIKRTLERMSHGNRARTFSWAGGTTTSGKIWDTLEKFRTLLDAGLEPGQFRQKLEEQFRVYKVESCDKRSSHQQSVLVTGYFQPEIRASYVRKGEFQYPLYARPNDLVSVDLRQFDQKLPARRLCGRVTGKKLLPYYTRAEIDQGKVPINATVLAWLSSPVDGLMLHIQGSGLLKFPNGESRHIHFAADNGHSYGSIGKWLIKKGWLRYEDADWPGIRKWATSHPGNFQQALRANPRYIFFKWEKDGPVGSLGTVLVPMVSVAMDPALFPPGALCFLHVPGKTVPEGKKWDFSGFVLNQDRGSAIKGPCHIDLYCGEGDRAGYTAGMLRHSGDLFLLMTK